MIANFPKSPRLQSLYFARNRISSIDARVTNNIPNLKTLVLTQNQISELADLDPLAGLRKLTHLTLIDNPVTSKEVSVRNMRTIEKTRVRTETDEARAELSLLGPLPLPQRALPRFPKGQGRRAPEGEGVVRHNRGAYRSSEEGASRSPSSTVFASVLTPV